VLSAVARLDEITGCGVIATQAIIAEIGLDVTVFGTPVGWCPGPWAARRPASPERRPPAARPSARATGTGGSGHEQLRSTTLREPPHDITHRQAGPWLVSLGP
jgi:hypothetical protein